MFVGRVPSKERKYLAFIECSRLNADFALIAEKETKQMKTKKRINFYDIFGTVSAPRLVTFPQQKELKLLSSSCAKIAWWKAWGNFFLLFFCARHIMSETKKRFSLVISCRECFFRARLFFSCDFVSVFCQINKINKLPLRGDFWLHCQFFSVQFFTLNWFSARKLTRERHVEKKLHNEDWKHWMWWERLVVWCCYTWDCEITKENRQARVSRAGNDFMRCSFFCCCCFSVKLSTIRIEFCGFMSSFITITSLTWRKRSNDRMIWG